MRRPIGQTLADNATQDRVGALFVSVGLGGIAEVEFGQVAVHVGLAHMMIGADHAALQDREEVFSGVGMRLTLAELRSEEHTSELQSLMRISYAVFCLKKKTKTRTT